MSWRISNFGWKLSSYTMIHWLQDTQDNGKHWNWLHKIIGGLALPCRSKTMYQDVIDANKWNLFQKSQQKSLSLMKQPRSLGRISLQILSQVSQKRKNMMHCSLHAAVIQNRHILSQHLQPPWPEVLPHSLETMSGNFMVYQKLHYQTEDRNSQLSSWRN